MSNLRTCEIYSDSVLTVIAVVDVNLHQDRGNTHYQLFGKLNPIAVIINGPEGKYILDMNAKPVNFDQFSQGLSDLEENIN